MRAEKDRPNSRDGGYTLIELLVVIAIMAAVAAIAFPMGARAIDQATLQSDARNFVSSLDGLRHAAIAHQSTIEVVSEDGIPRASNGASLQSDDGSTVRFAAGGTSLAFFADGTATGATFVVARGGESITVRLSPLIGDVGIGD